MHSIERLKNYVSKPMIASTFLFGVLLSNTSGVIASTVSPSPLLSTTETWAGTGEIGNGTDSLHSAKFNFPFDIVADEKGNLYISDSENRQIKKVSPDGIISIFSGVFTDNGGFVDGPAQTAQFALPLGLTIDTKGNLYVADQLNHSIRLITSDGKTSNILGLGKAGYKDGKISEALLSSPTDVAVDTQSNVYITDTLNHRIRKLTSDGTVTTLAGGQYTMDSEQQAIGSFADGKGETAKFNEPTGITIDEKGNLYVADTGNHLIRKITPDGTVTTLAGNVNGDQDGVGNQALFSFPQGIAINKEGTTLFIGDTGNNRIRSIDIATQRVQTITGTGEAGNDDGTEQTTRFMRPIGILPHGKELYVADQWNNKIRNIIPYSFPIDHKKKDYIQLLLNQEEIKSDVHPVLKEGRTFVPIRIISEMLNVPLTWDNTKGQVLFTIADTKQAGKQIAYTMKPNDQNIYQDGKVAFKMDVAPFIQRGRLLVPLRYISELYQLSVSWDSDTNTVVLRK